jgi:DNA topoisomerase-1
MLTQLVHNGVVVPDPPPPLGLVLTIQGEPVRLTAEQEEMALAWAKKQDTPYIQDPTFVRNFMADFSQALGLGKALSVDDVDFEPAIRVVEAEREARERMSREERKALAAERKAEREALREHYGYAIVNGERVELANYVVEPSGIFMGRGQHPMRGRWKEGARREDVTLNLSPDAPRPPGNWEEIVWQPESLWVARWKDKLSGKLKYVWLSDTATIKQKREALKFDKALRLDAELDTVRAQIEEDLGDPDPRKWRIATACYLIDTLCLRVGDEKDPGEADTVGATTLRPEHVTLHSDGTAEFRFLGKDSVLWHKKLNLPDVVRQNIEELIDTARPSNSSGNGDKSHPTRDKPQLFPDTSSRDVNAYLSDILPGLTAKVFRTHHATIAVQESLEEAGIEADDLEYKKWEAANLANLEAAMLCNHTKKEPASWARSQQRYQERRGKAEERVQSYREKLQGYRDALGALRQEAEEKVEAAAPGKRKSVRARYDKRIVTARRRVEQAKTQVEKARLGVGKIKAQASIAAMKRTWNLGTSLKSYIDPRVYYGWGQEVDYDVLDKYYPTALRRKFAWVRDENGGENGEMEERGAGRTGMPALRPGHIKLMIPGPVDSEDDVLAAMAEPTLPHYGKEWLETYHETIAHLQRVFKTENDLFLMAGPGTAGLDAALGSLTHTGDKVLVPYNGFFGRRLGTVARAYGLDVRTVEAPLGEPLDPEAIRRSLAAERDIQVLAVVHLETSTAVLNPLQDIAAVAREFDVPLVVDAVSSMGGVPVPVDDWGIDICVTVSNKCLGCPAGLAPVSVSQRAWDQMDRKTGRAHGWYLDLRVWKDYTIDWGSWHPYPTTLPTNNIVALLTSLRHILDEGLEAYYARYIQAARSVRNRLLPLGFQMLTPEAHTSPLITAMYGLPGMEVDDLRRYLMQEWQIMISGGLDDLAGKIFRVGHIGKAASAEYTERFLEGVEAYLQLRGYDLPPREL